MIASMHVADIGPSALFRRGPSPQDVDGLLGATMGQAGPLGGGVLPRVQLGRAALLAFWTDDAALDGFLERDPYAEKLAGGWHVRLEPLRAFGSWPGLPVDLERSRSVRTEGPTAVITIARLKITQAVRFFRTSAAAEQRVLRAPGLIWTTGFGRPPVVATCSLWESAQAVHDYAYGDDDPAHPDAIAEDRRRTFHRQKAFIRFRPVESVGAIEGKNPLPEDWLTSRTTPSPASETD